MSREQKRDLPASVLARLLARAKQSGEDYQRLLLAFVCERFLFRLGVSAKRDRFVLKGAMLLRAWSDQPYRATQDLDLLRRGDGSAAAVRFDVEDVCKTEVEPDGLAFDVATIREDAKSGPGRTCAYAAHDEGPLREGPGPTSDRYRVSATRPGRHHGFIDTTRSSTSRLPRSSRTPRVLGDVRNSLSEDHGADHRDQEKNRRDLEKID